MKSRTVSIYRSKLFILLLILALVLTIIGLNHLTNTKSHAGSDSIEAETFAYSGATTIGQDSTASNGQYLQFGLRSTPTSTPTSSGVISPSPTPQSTGGYHVSGNTIVDASGNVHLFHGVARPSLEWSATGDHLALSDYQLMKSWNANIVRLSLNQDFWLNNTSSYQATILQNVNWITSLGMDVILDLHWSDKGDSTVSPAQQRMADSRSNTFWQQVASAYKSNPHVLFELYNEPHDVSWSVWQNGGDSGDGFTVVGMQQLYNTVRATGAQNLVVIGGLNWAFDLSGVPTHRITGTNIVYATHPYDYSGKNTPSDWDTGFGNLSKTDPVIMTEFGNFNCTPDLYTSMLDYAKSHNVSWTAWAWYPGGCGFPSIINDWSGAPNTPGTVVKSYM